jgi:hypothetical protein
MPEAGGCGVERWLVEERDAAGRLWLRFCQDASGLKDGQELSWYANGRLRSLRWFLRGLRHGPSMSWYEDGSPRTRAVLRDGVEHGLSAWWRPGGLKAGEASWLHGKLHGKALLWAADGAFERGECWEHDRLRWSEPGEESTRTRPCPASAARANEAGGGGRLD